MVDGERSAVGDGGVRERLGVRIPALLVALASAALAIVVIGHVTGASTNRAGGAINGGPGKETIYGTQGADVIRGKGGSDKLIARNGDDLVFGGAGHDKIRGGKGNDRLIAGKAGAEMIGGQGRDEFNMSDGVQVGGRGKDVIHARDGTPDEINCGPGTNDVAIVDGSEDGIYDCETIIAPKGGGGG